MTQVELRGGGRGRLASYSNRLSTLHRNFIHLQHHPQALIASLGQLNAPPLQVLNFCGEQTKPKSTSSVPVDSYLVFKTNNIGKKSSFLCGLTPYAYRTTVNMINIQPEQLSPYIVSVSVLMYGATISWLITLDTAAHKQNGHVIRGAPYRQEEKQGDCVCINEDRM